MRDKEDKKLSSGFPNRIRDYPRIRFMGSKYRLLPWIFDVLSEYTFETVLDPFSGSGCVSYLMKAMGKQVTSSDFLNLSAIIARTTIENSSTILSDNDIKYLIRYDPKHKKFIEKTFTGIFFTPEDLRFLDRVSWNIRKFRNQYKKAIALSALIRSCAKRQPRGVFTVAGDPERYKDDRRDLKLSIHAHFIEQVHAFNKTVFDNTRSNKANKIDVFSTDAKGIDLVYLDPPYVPKSDDNCYIKRYHFLEGLSNYWEGAEILESSKVRKIKKRYTPFSYRREAIPTFNKMFAHFSKSIIVLSYSSNAYPDLDILVEIMMNHGKKVEVHKRNHRYHFGTHANARRTNVQEYLIIGE